MGADEPIGRCPADEEAPRDQPEVARPRSDAEDTERGVHRIGGGDARGLRPWRRAIGGETDVLRAIPHQEGDDGKHQERNGGHHQRHRPPAVARRDGGERGKEHELSCRRGRGEQSEHQAAARGEPAHRDRGGEHVGDRAGAAADDNAPQQDELPRLLHQRRGRDAERDQRECAEHGAADADRVHEGGRERADQAVEKDVDPDRERDGRPRPAELGLERHHEHARARANPGRHQQRQESHRRDDPGVVKPIRSGHRGSGCSVRIVRAGPAAVK